jgi:hypothetical protein
VQFDGCGLLSLVLNYPEVTFFSAVSDYIRCNGYNIIHTGYRMEILEVEGAANLRSLNWVDSRTGFDRRAHEYPKICKSTDVHILFCKHAILFGLSGSWSIYQPMFCPDVRASRRGAGLLRLERIYFSVWERLCRDQTSSSVKLEVVCCHNAVVWSLLFPCPWGCAAKCKLQFR